MGKLNLSVNLLTVITMTVLFSACATIQGDWQKTIQLDTKEAYLAFLQKHPDNEYASELIPILQEYATFHDRHAIPQFQKLAVSQSSTITQITLKGIPGSDFYIANGKGEYEINPQTGILEPMHWNPGAVHTLLGALEIEGYEFLSNAQDPLVFKMIRDKGYVYQRGKGIVIAPSGDVILLDSSRN